MPIIEFVEWLRRQGHNIIQTQSSYWYDIGPRVYQAIPYHNVIDPTKNELSECFKSSKAISLRYSTPITSNEGKLSYHVIYDQSDYELANLPKKARHDVIKGLDYANFEPINVTRLAKEGWSLRQDTLIRQGRANAETSVDWEKLCLSAEGLNSFEAWGALHEGNLTSALLACTIDDTVNILYQQSLSSHLKFGINNALAYVFTRAVLNRPDINGIFYGLHSLDAPSSVDEFKFRMNYSAKPVRQKIVFNPIISPLVQPLSHSLIKITKSILPANYFIAKTEGLIRFYLQGKLPLSKQEWPEILKMQSTEIAKQTENSGTDDLYRIGSRKNQAI